LRVNYPRFRSEAGASEESIIAPSDNQRTPVLCPEMGNIWFT